MSMDGISTKHRTRVGWMDTFALRPLSERWSDLQMAFQGDPHVPPTQFGISSVNIFKPSISFSVWANRSIRKRLAPIYNLFNHTPTAIEEGWSVKVTQVQDFRGKSMTYNSHNGTDFALPVGTPVVVSAPGRVLLINNEFHRGGLKVFVDHGRGVITSYNHLSRALVSQGDEVKRGQVVALSGASGLEMFLLFPWVAPHIHYNVWLNGEYVDPFARQGYQEEPLWLRGASPTPHVEGRDAPGVYEPSEWDATRVEEAIASCRNQEVVSRLEAIEELPFRAMAVMQQMAYFPGRFTKRVKLVKESFPRTPILDLPLCAEAYDGVWIPGGMG